MKIKLKGRRQWSNKSPDSRPDGQSSIYGWMLNPSPLEDISENDIESGLPIIKEEVVIDPILKEIAERLKSLDPIDFVSKRVSSIVCND